jgi:hypothetical protein
VQTCKQRDESFLDHFIATLQRADFGDFLQKGGEAEASAEKTLVQDIKLQLR